MPHHDYHKSRQKRITSGSSTNRPKRTCGSPTTLAVAVLARPQAHDVALAVHGDAQGRADGPVGDLALADLHVNSVDEHDSVNQAGSSGRDCQSAMPSMTRSVIVVIVCFDTSAP